MPRRPRPADPTRALELDGAAFREMVGLALDRLVPFVDGLPDQPTAHLDGSAKLARALAEDLPETGTSYRRLLGQLFERVLPVSLNTASPGYLAYVPGGGLLHAAVADLIVDATNRFSGLWMPAPGLVQLEINVVRWLATLVGLPDTAGGLLTSGGSIANLLAVVAARQAKLPPRFQDGVVYTSVQAHHSVLKAARVAGFLAENVRELPVDARYAVRVDALRAAIAADRAAGLLPFLVVGHGGTTAMGAVDDLDALATACADEGLWLHVDGAYGGLFAMTDRGRAALRGIERADSVTVDPHKTLFLPYGTGAVLVRDREALRRAFAVGASYLPPPQTDADRWDFADYGPELSRPTRGLRVWLPLKMHGVATFRAALDEKLDLARDARARVGALPGVVVVSEPVLSLFTFRVTAPGLDDEAADGLTRRVMSRVNQRQRVIVTGVTAPDPATGLPRFVIRVCVLSFRTHQRDIDALVEDLAAALADPRG